jgi:diguanylate cyclase (GGDEF)-like protein/PAS domain S-box-containing protein
MSDRRNNGVPLSIVHIGKKSMSCLVLIITDDVTGANKLRNVLAGAKNGFFESVWVRKLSEGIDRLRMNDVCAVLVDLFLPDSEGLATFETVFAVAPSAAIVTLCAPGYEDIAMETIQRGAHGYLPQDQFVSSLLPYMLSNIIVQKSIDETLIDERKRAAVTLASIGDGVISTDASGSVTYLNAAAERLTGWTNHHASGRPISKVFYIIDGITRQRLPSPVEFSIRENLQLGLHANSVLIRRDGSELTVKDSIAPIHDQWNHVIGAVIVFRDVGASQAKIEKMAYHAHYDFLTDLPNRMLLNDRISQAIEMAKRCSTQLAILFLDIDSFKWVNDTFGHAIGDQLLQSIAKRLASCVRSSDTVSRQGGDEFVILLGEDKHSEDAAITADKIIAALALPHHIAGRDLFITTSIGISVFPDDGMDVDTLIKNADTAMYMAKKAGRNNYKFYDRELNIRAVERQFFESNLRNALDHHEFVLYYQPRINLKTGKITGAEALIRWLHPVRGLTLPTQFVQIAEESNLLVPIGRWVLREACKKMKGWLDAGFGRISVGVNISASEFRSVNFIEDVQEILKDCGLEPSCLELELAESVLLRDIDSSILLLKALKGIGVRVAVDDFGIGYSSLHYLKQLRVDSLKIDRSFVRDITQASGESVLISAVIGMGKSLQQRVVAEGVEERSQFAFLSANECDEAQGYYFSYPLKAEQFTTLLGTGISMALLN